MLAVSGILSVSLSLSLSLYLCSLWFLNSYCHALSEYVWSYRSVKTRSSVIDDYLKWWRTADIHTCNVCHTYIHTYTISTYRLGSSGRIDKVKTHFYAFPLSLFWESWLLRDPSASVMLSPHTVKRKANPTPFSAAKYYDYYLERPLPHLCDL